MFGLRSDGREVSNAGMPMKEICSSRVRDQIGEQVYRRIVNYAENQVRNLIILLDGGQIGIFRSDLRYFSDFYQFVFDNSKKGVFHSEAGVAAHSGFGDGSYPVYDMNFEPDIQNGFSIGGLMVHFIV